MVNKLKYWNLTFLKILGILVFEIKVFINGLGPNIRLIKNQLLTVQAKIANYSRVYVFINSS